MISLKTAAKAVLPEAFTGALGNWWRRSRGIRWGNLRRLQPACRMFGLDRGQPIDRHYIEHFLEHNRADIHGRVLEVADNAYTLRFSGGRVTRSDVLHAVPNNSAATIVGDLARPEEFPPDTVEGFDCIILTQTLLFVYEVTAAIGGAFRLLKPGGVLLATFPGISQISRYDADRWGDYWRFTVQSATRLFGDRFGKAKIQVGAHGNVLVACAFLHGLGAHELTEEELTFHDPDYPVLITVRAVKGP